MTGPTPGGWQPKEILRFIRGFDTGTEAVLVLTDVGNGYLKAMGNRGGEHCLACEWVATHLARWFKLPTFDFALIKVCDLDEIPFFRGGRAQPGPAFIARAELGEPWGGKEIQLNRLFNPQDISRLVVFDTWVLNCDRHAPKRHRKPNFNNVFLSEEAPDDHFLLKAMDHTHAFSCGRELTPRIANLDHIKDPEVYGLFPGFRKMIDGDEFRKALDDLSQLPRQFVEEVVRSVPHEWDVPPNARAALTELIVQRALYLAHNRTGIMGLHLYQGHLDFPANTGDGP
jgi:hypothetical protein